MTSWNMLQIVRTAAELVDQVNVLTRNFPPEEEYVTVPLLRDHALNILENSALGMARFDVSYRYIYLTRAVMSLNELQKHLTLCKSFALMSPEDFNELVVASTVLKSQLDIALKQLEIIDTDDPFQF